MIDVDKLLNVPLFNALCELFDGDVHVTNVGEEGYIETVKSGDGLLAVRSKDCEQYMVNCPGCGDTRHRLYISHWALKPVKKGQHNICTDPLFYCQNEPTECRPKHSKLRKQLREIIKPGDIKAVTVPANHKYRKKGVVLKLPDGCIPINDPEVPVAIKDYIDQRGFDVDDLYNNWNVYACEHLEEYPQHGPKIIYPVTYNENLAFWQARIAFDPTKEQVRQGIRKYYFPPGSNKADVLYNKDRARFHKVVVITEGITDVHRIGVSGMAIFGKVPSIKQTQIFQHAFQHNMGIMLLDSDAGDEAEKYVRKYKGEIFPNGFYCVRLDTGDPASYTYDDLWEIIQSKVGEQIKNEKR